MKFVIFSIFFLSNISFLGAYSINAKIINVIDSNHAQISMTSNQKLNRNTSVTLYQKTCIYPGHNISYARGCSLKKISTGTVSSTIDNSNGFVKFSNPTNISKNSILIVNSN